MGHTEFHWMPGLLHGDTVLQNDTLLQDDTVLQKDTLIGHTEFHWMPGLLHSDTVRFTGEHSLTGRNDFKGANGFTE